MRQADKPVDSEAELDEVLANLEGAENYKAWILELLGPYASGRILEVGAGRGTFSHELRNLGQSLTAVEPSARLIPALQGQVDGLTNVLVVSGLLSEIADTEFDTAVMLNVLEHIDDDAAVVADVFKRLAPGGTFCVWVPAFAGLYGEFDRLVGHCRRYRKRDLEHLLTSKGFSIQESRYTNLPGFFAWWLVVRVAGAKPTSGRLATVYDRWFVPAIRAVEKRVKPPFGQSLFIVGRRP
jgi:SAM-dependent methyltransferase